MFDPILDFKEGHLIPALGEVGEAQRGGHGEGRYNGRLVEAEWWSLRRAFSSFSFSGGSHFSRGIKMDGQAGRQVGWGGAGGPLVFQILHITGFVYHLCLY